MPSAASAIKPRQQGRQFRGTPLGRDGSRLHADQALLKRSKGCHLTAGAGRLHGRGGGKLAIWPLGGRRADRTAAHAGAGCRRAAQPGGRRNELVAAQESSVAPHAGGVAGPAAAGMERTRTSNSLRLFAGSAGRRPQGWVDVLPVTTELPGHLAAIALSIRRTAAANILPYAAFPVYNRRKSAVIGARHVCLAAK